MSLIRDLDKRGTKSDPLPHYYLLAELVKDNQVSLYKEVNYRKIPKNPGRKRVRVVLKDKTYLITGIRTDKLPEIGHCKFYTTLEEKDIPLDTEFERIYIRQQKNLLKDFPVNAEIAGKYNESSKGGWYSKIPLYKYKNKYYCHYEYSFTMASAYSADAFKDVPKEFQ